MRRFSVSRMRLLQALAMCSIAILGMSWNSSALADPAVDLNIPAQDLSSALQAFGAAVNAQVLYSHDVVVGLRSAEVKGKFTANVAIQLLLKGSGLQADQTSSGVFLIRRASQLGDNPRAAVPNSSDKEVPETRFSWLKEIRKRLQALLP
jgi:hypothetical protein